MIKGDPGLAVRKRETRQPERLPWSVCLCPDSGSSWFHLAVAELVRPGSCAQPARLHDRGNGAAPDMAREPGLPAEGPTALACRHSCSMDRSDGPVLSHRKQLPNLRSDTRCPSTPTQYRSVGSARSFRVSTRRGPLTVVVVVDLASFVSLHTYITGRAPSVGEHSDRRGQTGRIARATRARVRGCANGCWDERRAVPDHDQSDAWWRRHHRSSR